MTKGEFVIRHTEGSGPRRNWTYLSREGKWVGSRNDAAHFATRTESYTFLRETLGDDEFHNSRNAGVRDNRF